MLAKTTYDQKLEKQAIATLKTAYCAIGDYVRASLY
jgi:hypothetical protein